MIPTENLRFREVSLTFKMMEQADQNQDLERHRRFAYPDMVRRGSYVWHRVVAYYLERTS